MPKPSFIIMCKSSSIDEITKQLSIFNVVEKFVVAPVPNAQEGERVILVWEPMRLIAEWLIDRDEDYDREFEHQLLMLSPQSEKPEEMPISTFRFEKGKPRARVIVTFDHPFPLEKTGTLRLEHRVRLKGSDSWESQSYFVLVDHKSP